MEQGNMEKNEDSPNAVISAELTNDEWFKNIPCVNESVKTHPSKGKKKSSGTTRNRIKIKNSSNSKPTPPLVKPTVSDKGRTDSITAQKISKKKAPLISKKSPTSEKPKLRVDETEKLPPLVAVVVVVPIQSPVIHEPEVIQYIVPLTKTTSKDYPVRDDDNLPRNRGHRTGQHNLISGSDCISSKVSPSQSKNPVLPLGKMKRKRSSSSSSGTNLSGLLNSILPKSSKIRAKDLARNTEDGPIESERAFIIDECLFSPGIDKIERPGKVARISKGNSSPKHVFDSPAEKDMYESLISRVPGFLYTPGGATITQETPCGEKSSVLDEGDDEDMGQGSRGPKLTKSTVPYISNISGEESLPLVVRQYCAIDPPPKLHLTAPLLTGELEGAFYHTGSLVRLKNGEVIGAAAHGEDGNTPNGKSLAVDEKEKGLFGDRLGSGQSFQAIDRVVKESMEKRLISTANRSKGATEGAIDRAVDIITGRDLSYSKDGTDYGTDQAAILGGQYMYQMRQPSTELGHIMGQLDYQTNFGMEKDRLGSLNQFYPNISIRSRRVEESYLRAPIHPERACIQGDACEGNFIVENGFVLVEFPYTDASIYQREHNQYPPGYVPGLCVICGRDNLHFLYTYITSICRAFRPSMIDGAHRSPHSPRDITKDAMSEEKPTPSYDDTMFSPKSTHESTPPPHTSPSVLIEDLDDDEGVDASPKSAYAGPSYLPPQGTDYKPLMLCSFTNMIGPGEYSPSSCIMAGSSPQYRGLPGCFVVHSRRMYSHKVVNGINWYIQHYPKPEEVPQENAYQYLQGSFSTGFISFFNYYFYPHQPSINFHLSFHLPQFFSSKSYSFFLETLNQSDEGSNPLYPISSSQTNSLPDGGGTSIARYIDALASFISDRRARFVDCSTTTPTSVEGDRI
jgi:hypothetical protein